MAAAQGRTFVGFGLGAIQTGLFLWEAQRSGNFSRLVVALPNAEVVAGLRRAGGRFWINIATSSGRVEGEICGVEILNPTEPHDRRLLVDAIAGAAEMATALPSVATYGQPGTGIAELLAEGFRQKLRSGAISPCVLYASENHNHAADHLAQAIRPHLAVEEEQALRGCVQFVDTVIGKMSRVVRDRAEIVEAGLRPYVNGGSRAYLVEAFNRILISQVTLPGFKRGIQVFEEKPDLLPFEEAKLYGHNAVHALLGYLGRTRGLRFISEAATDATLLTCAREAFMEESGRALIARRGGVDPLFTEQGYRAYADDLLVRMVNPWLRDDVDRVTRDARRKLGWHDRLVGTMRLALAAGIEPQRLALAAAAALNALHAEEPNLGREALLDDVWGEAVSPERSRLRAMILGSPGMLGEE